jgi:hypothetical protein
MLISPAPLSSALILFLVRISLLFLLPSLNSCPFLPIAFLPLLSVCLGYSFSLQICSSLAWFALAFLALLRLIVSLVRACSCLFTLSHSAHLISLSSKVAMFCFLSTSSPLFIFAFSLSLLVSLVTLHLTIALSSAVLLLCASVLPLFNLMGYRFGRSG